MILNNLQKQSIIDSAKEDFGLELDDETLSEAVGGRCLRIEESGRITRDRKNFYRRKRTPEEMSSFENAVSKYITYIRSLDDDSESVLFSYSEWRD